MNSAQYLGFFKKKVKFVIKGEAESISGFLWRVQKGLTVEPKELIEASRLNFIIN